jgi:tRNA U34 5-methylaminomethyl-2-thiouridine-forming methyltransferase MnmC
MNRHLIITEDGSHSLFVPELDEQYHSIHGAIQESNHVFIESGLKMCRKKNLVVFEVGFGTGLNAFLTLLAVEESKQRVSYIGIEKYPLKLQEYCLLNYAKQTNPEFTETFQQLHGCKWGQPVEITSQFSIQKIKSDCRDENFETLPFFDIIYFDAFAPNKQPDLWQDTIYRKFFDHCNEGAIFVTYCAKGIVRRDLQNSGFHVERIPGPLGKKEMLRAIKLPISS